MTERGSRFESSVVTFGPVGRVIATVLVVLPIVWFLRYGWVYGLVGAVLWLFWVLPRALRDIWQRALLPPTELTRLRDAARLAAEHERAQEARALADEPPYEPPRRW